MQYDDIFVSVRQKVAAFMYWREYYAKISNKEPWETYGGISESCYLDEAYRFLYTSASAGFMRFCAGKEGMTLPEYCKTMDVDINELIPGKPAREARKGKK